MNFSVVILKQNIKIILIYVIWINIVLLFNTKTENVYKDISNDAEQSFDPWNYTINRPLPTEKNKKL